MTELFQWLANFIKEFRVFVTILPWELAVRTRLGSRVTTWAPGWYLKIPFVDTIHVVNTRTRVIHSPTQTVTTRDGKALSCAFSIGFAIFDPQRSLLQYSDPEDVFAALVQSHIAGLVASLNAADVSPGALETHAQSYLIQECRDLIKVSFVRVVDFAMVRTYRIMQDQWRPMNSGEERKV